MIVSILYVCVFVKTFLLIPEIKTLYNTLARLVSEVVPPVQQTTSLSPTPVGADFLAPPLRYSALATYFVIYRIFYKVTFLTRSVLLLQDPVRESGLRVEDELIVTVSPPSHQYQLVVLIDQWVISLENEPDFVRDTTILCM